MAEHAKGTDPMNPTTEPRQPPAAPVHTCPLCGSKTQAPARHPLSPKQAAILRVFVQLVEGGGGVSPSITTIAAALGRARITVYENVLVLERKGWLVKVGTRGTGARYILAPGAKDAIGAEGRAAL